MRLPTRGEAHAYVAGIVTALLVTFSCGSFIADVLLSVAARFDSAAAGSYVNVEYTAAAPKPPSPQPGKGTTRGNQEKHR